jgi:hypothetical protein
MIDELSPKPSPEYAVFACPGCGKWQYCKATKPHHRCICGKALSPGDLSPQLIRGVNNAHVLCRNKNLEWQLAKGVIIPNPPAIKKTQRKPKKASVFHQPDPEEKLAADFNRLLERMLVIVHAQGIPEPIPVPFFSALFTSINTTEGSFTRFLRYWETRGHLHRTDAGILIKKPPKVV